MSSRVEVQFRVNGRPVSVEAPPETPLLWILRDHLALTGTRYGCGIGSCGACTVHVEGEPVFSCSLPLSGVAGREVATIEGLGDGREGGRHPLQDTWVAEQVPQCGYCQSGQIMRAAALLERSATPSRGEIVEYMRPVLCRCGTYLRIVRAIEAAARSIQGEERGG